MTRAFVLGAAVLAGLAATVVAQEPAKPVDLAAEYQSLVDTERAFAKKSMESNAREAFLAFIADDGVMFTPDPVSGKELWQKRAVPEYTLDWWPSHADVSRSADLGWDTGPWVFTQKDGVRFFGYFATVWRKQADGTWRFVADLGASMPVEEKRGVEPGPLDPAKLAKSTAPVDPKEAENALLDADRALGVAAGKGLEAAYGGVLAEDVRLMRPDHAPFVGKSAAALRLTEEKGTFSSKPIGGGSARAGDLGYVYGSYERKGEKPESGSYLRVWERDPGQDWRLVLEVLNPRAAG